MQTGAGHTGGFLPRDRAGLPPFRPPEGRPLRIALISPRFKPTFFGRDFLLPLLPGDKRSAMAAGALPLLASMVPEPHEVAIFDEMVAPLPLQELRDFDIVGITGMMPQAGRIRAILEALAGHPGLIIAGGTYASVDEQFFSGLADVCFVGEADVTWPAFLADLAAGRPWQPRQEQGEKTDMTTLPVPEYGGVPLGRYASTAVQFSRGCPFLCEFCDIITIFGRRPRAKAPAQVLAELDALVARGVRNVFLVDDNFIGNKKLARGLLEELAAWQKARGHPLRLSTEASIDLADQPELLSLMVEAGFNLVFIGIESASAESLAETRKVQNIRGDSIAAKIARIHDAGMLVEAGFMIGFDNDGPETFALQEAFIEELAIAAAIVSPVMAIPGTPLYNRLAAEGRLRDGHEGCNFEPAGMSRETLVTNVDALNLRLYQPEAYFRRYFAAADRSPGLRARLAADRAALHSEPLPRRLARTGGQVLLALRLAAAMARAGELRSLGARYLAIYRQRRARRNEADPGVLEFVAACALHWHYWRLYTLREKGEIAATGFGNLDPVAQAAE